MQAQYLPAVGDIVVNKLNSQESHKFDEGTPKAFVIDALTRCWGEGKLVTCKFNIVHDGACLIGPYLWLLEAGVPGVAYVCLDTDIHHPRPIYAHSKETVRIEDIFACLSPKYFLYYTPKTVIIMKPEVSSLPYRADVTISIDPDDEMVDGYGTQARPLPIKLHGINYTRYKWPIGVIFSATVTGLGFGSTICTQSEGINMQISKQESLFSAVQSGTISILAQND